jgi:predicted nucleotide-binding protein (sugar kinase/HSP70/actin superfamily)
MRIGIPQGLVYFNKYGRLWKRNLNAFGIEVVTSPETTEGILSDVIKHSVCDLCLSVKAFFGHVLALKDNVDCLFIPRVIRVEPDAFLCPKFLGLPDMVRAAIRNRPRIIDTEFNIKEKTEILFWNEVYKELKGNKNPPFPPLVKGGRGGQMKLTEKITL